MLHFSTEKSPWLAQKVTSVARRVADSRFHARIILGSWLERSRIGPALYRRFSCFLEISVKYSLKSHFFWQAQYLVMFEGNLCRPRIVNNVSYVTIIHHESHFSWQVLCLVMLENNLCSLLVTVVFGNFSGWIRKLVFGNFPGGFRNFPGCIRQLLYSGNLDLATKPLYSETVRVGFGNLYSETFPGGFGNFSGWIRKLCRVDSETFPGGFGNFSGCIRKLGFGNFS